MKLDELITILERIKDEMGNLEVYRGDVDFIYGINIMENEGHRYVLIE